MLENGHYEQAHAEQRQRRRLGHFGRRRDLRRADHLMSRAPKGELPWEP